MKKWVVRLGSLFVFNAVVLLLIGWILPRVWVGFGAAIIGGVVLTLATVWVKPAVSAMLTRATAQASSAASKTKKKLIEYGVVFAVALVVWILVKMFSNVVSWGFAGLILPPLMLMLAWLIYDVIDDRLEKVASDIYDRAVNSSNTETTAPATDSEATRLGRAELNDGLTDEQRKMLGDL